MNGESKQKTALIVDDEADIRELLSITLKKMGLDVVEAEDIGDAIGLLKERNFNLCLTDMRLPNGNGLQLVEYIQDSMPELPVAVITAFGNVELAVDALKKGAFDFVSKPIELGRLRSMVETALELDQTDSSPEGRKKLLVGGSQAMNQLRQQISRLARSEAPVYISGESGSGKEIVARSIHYQGPRGRGPFIPVNCGAIPAELMESEFFGHKKGSFTGAHQNKQGLFQAANGGTLFLDEVADLPLALQVKLLRTIQEKSVRPVGSEEEFAIDVRILSASHKHLEREVQQGRFRSDLYYRINVIEMPVPSLRDHPEDIAELSGLFLNRFADKHKQAVPKLGEDALILLENYPFPGNVRELENILERAFILRDGEIIQAKDLNLDNCRSGIDASLFPVSDTEDLARVESLDEYLENVERQIISQALEKYRWNKTATAKRLGISFRQMRYKLKKLDLE